MPDEMRICKFQRLLAKEDLNERLFELIGQQLDAVGLGVRWCVVIHAFLVRIHRRASGDLDADMAPRDRKVHQGYKAHVTLDEESKILRHI